MKQTITLEMLQELDVCQSQVLLFQQTFGNSFKLTQKSIDKAIDVGLEVFWMFQEFKLTGYFVDKDYQEYWFKNGKLHRTDGPAFEYANGDKEWYINGKLHRTDGPAFEYANGDKEWYKNGKPHREDGPAFEYVNGNNCWYTNGELYREDGPAIEYANGDKEWWENGRCIRRN